MRTLYPLAFLLFSVLLLGACKTKKSIGNNTNALKIPEGELNRKKLIEDLVKNKNSSEWLYSKAEVQYKDEKQELNFDMEIQAHQDDYIWLNARAMGLLNVARILIKPDSIRVIDLINKVYISASYEYLKKFSPNPIGFNQLQNIVWGNAPFDPTENAQVDSAAKTLSVLLLLSKAKQESEYLNNLKTAKAKLTDTETNRTMEIEQEHYMDFGQNSIPSTRIFNIQSEKKVECRFQLNNIALSSKREPSFVVPKTYKVIVY